MKKIIGSIVCTVFIVGILGFFGSCDLLNKKDIVTAPERVDEFIAGVLAGSWTSLQSNFYGKGEPDDFEAMNDGEDYWKTTLFHDADSISVSGDPADDATSIDGEMKISGNTYGLTFDLKQHPDDDNYYITTIDLTDFPDSDDIRLIIR